MIYAKLDYHNTDDHGGMHTNVVLCCLLCRAPISGQDGGGDALCAGCVHLIVGREPRWAFDLVRDLVREVRAGAPA